MFETTLLESVSEQSPVLTRRHRMIAMLAGTTVFVAAWKTLPLLFFHLTPEASLAVALTLGAGVALQALMACYAFAAARRLGLNRVGWLGIVLLASVVGFMAFLIRAARRTGDWQRAAMPMATTFEVAALGALLLVPLIRTQALDLRNVRDQDVPLPPLPQSVRIVAVIREAGGSTGRHRPSETKFFIPNNIPDRVDTTPDPPRIGRGGDESPYIGAPVDVGCPTCVIGSMPWARAFTPLPPPQQPSKQKAVEPKIVTSVVQAAKLIFAPKPEYPAIARIARVEGEVRMAAIISTDGTIQSLHVLSGNPLLVPAARDAVARWRYQPTLLNGETVEVQTEIVVNFYLIGQ